jgi:hypothetical protein
MPPGSYKYLRHDNQEMGNLIPCRAADDVQNYIIPSGFSVCKECLTLAAVTKFQGLLLLDVDMITGIIITASRVLLNGSL